MSVESRRAARVNNPTLSLEEIRRKLSTTRSNTGQMRRFGSSPTAEMNTISLLADPNIGPQNIVAVPLGGVNTGGERTGLMGPTQQPETPAADYITQIGMERRKEEIQRGLLGADQPNGLAGKSTDVGAGIAQDQNTINSLSGLLGDIDYKGILNQLVKTFQRPEMLTPGVNALTAFGMSGAALNQSEMAAAAAEQERMDKLAGAEQERMDKFAIEQLKNAGPKEFKGPMIKSIEKAAATRQSLDAINTYLELLSNKRIGGVGAKTEEGINAIGALFGAGGESGAATARSIRSQIITALQLGVNQGQISQADYDQLNNILSGDGWFVSNPKVEAQLQRLKGVLGGKLATTTKILEAQGIDPSRFSPDAPSGLVSARRPAQ